MEEELISMDDNIIPDIEIDINKDIDKQHKQSGSDDDDNDLVTDDHNNEVNINNNNNNLINNDLNEMHGFASRLRHSIHDFLGLDQRINDPIDDPCPLYFIAIVTLIYFPIGILIMLITCCGFRLNPQQQPKNAQRINL